MVKKKKSFQKRRETEELSRIALIPFGKFISTSDNFTPTVLSNHATWESIVT
jgi:hypothetical protein